MKDLLRERARETDAAIRKNRKRKEKVTVYSMSGKVVRGKLPGWEKAFLWMLIILAALVLFIYVPPIFEQAQGQTGYTPVTTDASAIKAYQTYLKDNPDADFDGDGLNNDLEESYGTDVWNIDTDGDGVSDYAELFLTETSPVEASTVIAEQVIAEDKQKGNSIGTPYKIDDIIFWPDGYVDKSYGGVVRTVNGYRFCNYNGWVRFPQEGYAYRYKDGIHYSMKYREAENAYYIENADEIRIYDEPLTFVNCLELPFMDTIYLEDGGIGDILSDILPSSGGPVVCQKKATLDVEKGDLETVTAPLRQPLIDRSDTSRLSSNTNTLQDLSTVRKHIEAGNCVAASLYSGNVGEAIVIIYGYTEDGNLLAADESLNPVGTIYITETAKRMMDKEGTIGQISWFEWAGLGFSSAAYGDRINFFASTATAAPDEEPDEAAESIESMTEAQEETDTEANTEVQADAVPESTEQTEVQQTEPQTEVQQTEGTQTTEKNDSVITFSLGG